jgi:hypothetical protein
MTNAAGYSAAFLFVQLTPNPFGIVPACAGTTIDQNL